MKPPPSSSRKRRADNDGDDLESKRLKTESTGSSHYCRELSTDEIVAEFMATTAAHQTKLSRADVTTQNSIALKHANQLFNELTPKLQDIEYLSKMILRVRVSPADFHVRKVTIELSSRRGVLQPLMATTLGNHSQCRGQNSRVILAFFDASLTSLPP
jgi:hypothetical protein